MNGNEWNFFQRPTKKSATTEKHEEQRRDTTKHKKKDRETENENHGSSIGGQTSYKMYVIRLEAFGTQKPMPLRNA